MCHVQHFLFIIYYVQGELEIMDYDLSGYHISEAATKQTIFNCLMKYVFFPLKYINIYACIFLLSSGK